MFDKNMNDQFKQMQGGQPQQVEEEMFYDDDDEDFGGAWEQQTIPTPGGQQEQQEFREYNNPVHTEDEELAPGLYQSDIDSWKRQFGENDVFLADIQGTEFIFRTLQRYEYKDILAIPNSDPIMREEVICEYCVLYPQGYSFAQMANKKAGLPTRLSSEIMELSGFTKDVKIKRL